MAATWKLLGLGGCVGWGLLFSSRSSQSVSLVANIAANFFEGV